MVQGRSDTLRIYGIIQLAFLLSLLLGFAGLARAHDYSSGLDRAQWFLDASRFECRLWQTVPSYGDAVFSRPAGGELAFYLKSRRPVDAEKVVYLKSEPPAWRSHQQPRTIGRSKVVKGTHPLTLSEELASEMLAELQIGMFPRMEMPGWYKGHLVDVSISAVNFSDAYEDYLSCITALLPVNFDQIKRSVVHFDSDYFKVNREIADTLDLIAEYLKEDDNVEKVFIDGHADAIGKHYYNHELSHQRARAVWEYLIGLGIDEQRLVMRYHGESFPVKGNNSKNQRSKNRRVTLRMQRKNELL